MLPLKKERIDRSIGQTDSFIHGARWRHACGIVVYFSFIPRFFFCNLTSMMVFFWVVVEHVTHEWARTFP